MPWPQNPRPPTLTSINIYENRWQLMKSRRLYIYIYIYINLRKSKTLSIRASRIVWKLPTSVGSYENICKTKPPNIDFLEGRRPERQHVGKHKKCDCVCMHCCHIYDACATKNEKKSNFNKSLIFVRAFLCRFIRRSVHSAKLTSIRPRLRSSGREYVHPAENTSIRRHLAAEWTDFVEKLIRRMNRTPTAKPRSFGENLVHSAQTPSTLERNACIAYVHSAETYVHSANYVHSAPNEPKPEVLGIYNNRKNIFAYISKQPPGDNARWGYM